MRVAISPHRRYRPANDEHQTMDRGDAGSEEELQIFDTHTRARVAPAALEHELQTELQFPHRCSRAVDRPVQRVRHCRTRIAPDRIVQRVERLESELQVLIAEAEVPD